MISDTKTASPDSAMLRFPVMRHKSGPP